MTEIWKDIKGYEGFYQVSNMGNVRSMDREIIRADGMPWRKYGRVLRPSISIHGYKRVTFSVNGQNKTFSVHGLVARTFIPNDNPELIINHIDENKLNNCVDNLEWVTQSENLTHGISMVRRAQTQRFTQPRKKRVYQITKAGNIVGVYMSIRDAARQTGYERAGISHCCHHQNRFPSYKGFKWEFAEE